MQDIPLALVAALDDELRLITSKIEADSRVHIRPALFTVGKYKRTSLVICRSGIGILAMELAMRYLLEQYRPRFCLHIGYCGGSNPKDLAGDLIIATTAVDTRSGERHVCDANAVEDAVHLARDKGMRARIAAVATVEKPVEFPHEKAFIGTQYEVAGIDMESAAVAVACKNRSTRFLIVRAILDPLDVALPDIIDAVEDDGSTNGTKLARHFVRKPKDLWLLPRLQYLASIARTSLTGFVDAWIERERS